jgi:hypothetical protein
MVVCSNNPEIAADSVRKKCHLNNLSQLPQRHLSSPQAVATADDKAYLANLIPLVEVGIVLFDQQAEGADLAAVGWPDNISPTPAFLACFTCRGECDSSTTASL